MVKRKGTDENEKKKCALLLSWNRKGSRGINYNFDVREVDVVAKKKKPNVDVFYSGVNLHTFSTILGTPAQLLIFKINQIRQSCKSLVVM